MPAQKLKSKIYNVVTELQRSLFFRLKTLFFSDRLSHQTLAWFHRSSVHFPSAFMCNAGAAVALRSWLMWALSPSCYSDPLLSSRPALRELQEGKATRCNPTPLTLSGSIVERLKPAAQCANKDSRRNLQKSKRERTYGLTSNPITGRTVIWFYTFFFYIQPLDSWNSNFSKNIATQKYTICICY